MSKKTQHGACIKPKYTNLKRNPDLRLSVEVIDRLSSEFGFRSDSDLRGALGETLAGYRKLTCQTLLQRRKQHSLTKRWLRKASKRAQRDDDGKLFQSSLKKASLRDVIYISIGGSNPFRDSLEKSAIAAEAALEMMERPGRPKSDSALLIYSLVHIYEKGTGKRAGIPNVFWAKERIESAGPFFRFVTEVFRLAGIKHKPGVLAKQIQQRIKELRGFRGMRGSHR